MDLVLIGERLSLIPIDGRYLDELLSFSIHPEIWEYLPVQILTKDDILNWKEQTLALESSGKVKAFLIQNNDTKEILGSTRLFDIDEANKKLEIGFTWLNPKYFGQNINLESKLLLLSYCFDSLGFIRVQFKTDEKNIRSRKAIEKLGASLEGTLRNNKIRRDGSIGNSLVFSIISYEWQSVKNNIIDRLSHE